MENFFGIVGKLVWFDHRFSRLSHLGGKDEHRSTTTNWNNFSGASHKRLASKSKGAFRITILDLEGSRSTISLPSRFVYKKDSVRLGWGGEGWGK